MNMRGTVFNVRLIKVGGIWFLTLGRVHFSFCVSRTIPRCFEERQ
jgi:hypothetical protein